MTVSFVALDVEATGMNPARDEIIEVALVVFDRDGTSDTFQSVIRPRSRVSLDVASLTGLSSAELDAAPSFADISATVRRHLAGRPLVGHSIWMDVAMLDAAGIVLPNPLYDTYDLATLVLPDLPSYTLRSVASHLGVDVAGVHRALADATLTADVFTSLLKRVDRYDTSTLEQMAAMARAGEWGIAALLGEMAASRSNGPLFEQTGNHGRGPHELAFLMAADRPEPLRRSRTPQPVDPKVVSAVLAAPGPLTGVLAGYEHRPQQESMALAVTRALNDDAQLLVEAGTGTGKSVAYLLPAILHAVQRGENVVVSTNTLALQDQLFRKDIPDLRRALDDRSDGVPFSVSVLKGRANYLCLRRWFAAIRTPPADRWDARLRAKILAWLDQTETGDRAELRLGPEEEVWWRTVAEEEDACVASRCVFQQRNQCFLYRARRNAEHAHVVIVNHALLLSDVMAGSRVLPDYDRLIIDEAHHLEDQATTQFGFRLDQRAVNDYVDSVARVEGPLTVGSAPTVVAYLHRLASDKESQTRADAANTHLGDLNDATAAIRSASAALFARLVEFIGLREDRSGGFDRSLRLTGAVRRDSAWVEVELLWEPLDAALRQVDDHLRWFVEAVEAIQLPEDDGNEETERDQVLLDLGLAVRSGVDISIKLQSAIAAPREELVYWIERSQVGDRASLHAAPLHVGEVLRDQLFAPLRTLVLTSATLTTDGTFDYITERLGLEDPEEAQVSSPFDYQRSTLLYLADDIPEPNLPGYQRRLYETLISVCDATRGRALVLFTSHASLQATYRAIKKPLEERGVLVLAQRTDGSPRQLIDRLKSSPHIVVLGTSTFWEGVDVVGPALSLLVVTKFPFSVPSDPVFAARSELFDRPFLEYAVPQAALRFKQGFGRLIRSSQDRGVCAVLDRRALSKRYGSTFIESLPDCTVSVGSAFDLASATAEWLDDTSGRGLNGKG